MTQKIIINFFDEIYSKQSKKNYTTIKTFIHQIDVTWSSDILNLSDYGPENDRGFR